MCDGKWVKPQEAEGAQMITENVALYNFITDPIGDSIIVEGVITSTLGQFCEGTHKADKPTHQLWNSPKIVDLLRRHRAWPNILFGSEDAAIKTLKDVRFATAYLAHLKEGSLAGLSFQQIVGADPAQ